MSTRSEVWFVYIIQSEADSSLYTGVSTDPIKRLKAHNSGKGAKRTRGRGPWRLLGVRRHKNRSRAMEEEYQLKHTLPWMKLSWCERHSYVGLRWYKPEED